MTMNTTWGYSEHDDAWKTPETLLRTLIDIASKGGNFLLNIGPKGDGSIPVESIESMQYIGSWMKQNGVSIYGTQASPFERPEWGRCTSTDEALYLHIFDPPADGVLTVPVPSGEVKAARLLATGRPLGIKPAGDGITITLPNNLPAPIPVVVLEKNAAER
jgi:alpha-L-fucosidase